MLQRRATFAARRRRGFGYKLTERNHAEFRDNMVARLDDLARIHAEVVDRHADRDYAPIRTLRIDLTQHVSHVTFKSDLESVGIETVLSALEKHWIVAGAEDYAGKLTAKIEDRIGRDKATFVDAIEQIGPVIPEEKMGGTLSTMPIEEAEDVDVEVWRLPDDRIKEFGDKLYKIAREGRGELTDMFYTTDYAIRVRCGAALCREIAALPEVARISRPLPARAGARLDSDIRDIGAVEDPDPDAPGILVVDSGIVKHPLLERAIAEFVPVDDAGGAGGDMYDDSGHGTHVAGVAAYGDVQACADSKTFRPKARLYSAKVMKRGPDGDAVFDGLVDGKIKRAVDEIAAHHPSCRIVNLSLGDSARAIAPGMPQPRLALLVDRLSTSHKNLLFVVSAGNIEGDAGGPYPQYLLDRPPETCLIDPATSAHAITVGSVFRRHVGLGYQDHPSPNTRVGPGLAGMAKPDVVERGGGYAGPGSAGVLTLNMEWVRDGRLFTFDTGTSMSAPKVAHTLALLQKALPGASRNMFTALLISSAKIPAQRPPPLDALSTSEGKEQIRLLHIYGHGMPDLDRAAHSRPNRTVLVHDGSMRLNHAELFAVRVPRAFTASPGQRTIEVTLAFDPPTDGKRAAYLGAAMKYHLYKNVDPDTVRRCYEDAGKPARKNAPTADLIKNDEIKLFPGVLQRASGAHQKARTVSRGGMGIDTSRPLTLVVIAEKRWIEEEGYAQGYAVAVTFEHSSGIDIYTELKAANRARARSGAP